MSTSNAPSSQYVPGTAGDPSIPDSANGPPRDIENNLDEPPADGVVNRKPKRSRWGSTAETIPAAAEQPKKRRSRWGSENDKVEISPEMSAATAAMMPQQRELYLLRLRMQDITLKLANVQQLIPADPALRSPSPAPEYDTNGKRTNTREQRIRDNLIKERNELIEKSIRLNPQFAAPSDFKRQKFVAKLMIPQDEPCSYVDGAPPPRPHSYCGMILGPRGLTQKRMQKETNCKIEIRGRGSQKEGRRHKPHPSDNEDLHVLITGENDNDLQRCVKMIEQLLEPVNEDNNEHKARQLRELAAINGTLRDEIRCRLCGERGHFVDKCPERTGAAWNPANVRCEVCGERGHPTSDCPTGGTVNTAERSRLKNEYDNFMSELSGKAPPPPSAPASNPDYDDGVPQCWPPPPPPPPAQSAYPPPVPPPTHHLHATQPWNPPSGFYPPPPPAPGPPPSLHNTEPPHYGGPPAPGPPPSLHNTEPPHYGGYDHRYPPYPPPPPQ